jgi:cytochrome d ubiquinol oxidase subunit II
MQLDAVSAFVLLLALSAYVLTGGADFGAGFWELIYRGDKHKRENAIISAALAPIWEANHVWLVFAIVLISGAFPKALSALSVALNIPLMLMLIGVSLRGSAFVFRRYGPPDIRFQARWSMIFGLSSSFTPVFLGIIMGTAVSGAIRVLPDGSIRPESEAAWLGPFPLAVGIYTFAIGVFLSAVYLAAHASESQFRESIRRRAVGASVALGVVAWVVLLVAKFDAPLVFERLTAHSWSWPFHIVTAAFSVSALVLLIRNHLYWARAMAVLQVLAIMIGLGLAQYPYIVAPDLTIDNAAAPLSSLRILLLVTFLGLILVAPAFIYLYWIFQIRPQGAASTIEVS